MTFQQGDNPPSFQLPLLHLLLVLLQLLLVLFQFLLVLLKLLLLLLQLPLVLLQLLQLQLVLQLLLVLLRLPLRAVCLHPGLVPQVQRRLPNHHLGLGPSHAEYHSSNTR